MGWYSHHSTLAVAHQHVIGNPYRQLYFRQWMDDKKSRVHAFLFLSGELSFHGGSMLAFLDELGKLWIAFCRIQRNGMLGCHGNIGYAKQCVSPGSKNFQRLWHAGTAVRRKDNVDAETLADPVDLHGLYPLWPSRERT